MWFDVWVRLCWQTVWSVRYSTEHCHLEKRAPWVATSCLLRYTELSHFWAKAQEKTRTHILFFRPFPYLHVTVLSNSQDNTIGYPDEANKLITEIKKQSLSVFLLKVFLPGQLSFLQKWGLRLKIRMLSVHTLGHWRYVFSVCQKWEKEACWI